MHSKHIALFFVVAFLTSSSLGLHHLVVTARRSLDTFLARQLDTGECDSVCSTIESTLTSCNTTGCLCTVAIAASLQVCINCAVGDDPTVAIVSSAQMIIDTFEGVCSTVVGVPSVTINTNPGTATQTTVIAPSTTIVPVTTVSQVVIGPSSTTSASSTQASSSVGSTSTAIEGLPLRSNAASPNKIFLHWTVALLGLAAGNLLVF